MLKRRITMKTNEIMNTITRKFHRIGFQLKKHSPEILVVAGVVGGVTSAVMACKATTKAGDIIEDTKSQLDIIHKGMEDGNIRGVEYTKEDGTKDLTIVYTQTAVKFVKLYGPAVALGTASIVSILAGHNITRKRNLALTAAYATIDNSFKQYRNRVIERFGEGLDRELKYDVKTKEVEETVVNEDGTESTVKTTVNVIDPNTISDYSRIFDECNPSWSKSPEHNLVFLKQQQNYANDLLKSRGHLFLNEVYDMLGFPRTQAGQIVGWVYDDVNPVGDNFVDFGIYNLDSERARAFVNGYERSILLDFNVDGNVWKLLK
jgi:hypothetical protein